MKGGDLTRVARGREHHTILARTVHVCMGIFIKPPNSQMRGLMGVGGSRNATMGDSPNNRYGLNVGRGY